LSGAEYQFLRDAFPQWPVLAFLAGFFVALNAAGAAATVALAFAGYLAPYVPWHGAWSALALLVLCTAVNAAGVRQSAGLGMLLVSLEVGGLVLVGALGFLRGDPAQALAWPQPAQAGALTAAAALLFFAYLGFEHIANFAEEAKQPARDLHRALLLSVVITTVLYVLLVWAVLSLVDPRALATSAAPLATAAAAAGGWTAPMVSVAAVAATASTALLALASASRLLFAMARTGDLPASLARTGRRSTPWAAGLLLLVLACALLPLGKVSVVAGVSSLGILVAFTGVHACVIATRRDPAAATPGFRIPFAVGGVPVTAAAGIAINLLLMLQFEQLVYVVTGGIVVGGLAVHALARLARWHQHPLRPASHPDPFRITP
jgi:APA family basic amino acid/polyamine antiporter